jgi:glycosyltransferase involved in cell wall biosynthesis
MNLSIIIPLYDKEKYLDRCLKNLLAQEGGSKEIEIIIVDDGSTDSSGSIAKRYVEDHNNVQLLIQENAGPSAARNYGLKAAKGDYIYFLDADDYLVTDVLNYLIETCVNNQLEILEFNTIVMSESQSSDRGDSLHENHPGLVAPVMDGASYIEELYFRNEVWRYLIKRSFLLNSGIKFLTEMRAYEDLIFTASIFLRAHRIGKVNVNAHRHVKVEGSIVRSKDPVKNREFIDAMVLAVERLDELIKDFRRSCEHCSGVLNRLKAKQQAVVIAFLIRVVKYRLLSRKEIKLLLDKLNTLDAYPIDPKLGGFGGGGFVFRRIMTPIINNRAVLQLGVGLTELFPRN